jgi:aminoglycoside 2'-N-acetyltransferase I
MTRLDLVHTGALAPGDLCGVRLLLHEAFAGDLDEQDVEHCLGGVHALLWDGPVLLAHGALVQRRLLHRGRALRAGYLEGVAVRPQAQRRGHGAAVMGALEDLGRGAYDLLALSTSEEGEGFYAARGWLPWRGPTSVLAPDGVRPTPEDDDAVRVLPLDVPLDLAGALTCDWREGDAW